MVKPTHQDAIIMLRLYQWTAIAGLSKAINWMWSDDFITDYAEFIKKYPRGSESYEKATRICGYYETIGTLYKNGLFNEELLFDWLAVYLVWDRIKDFAIGLREEAEEPRIFENFEAMAKAQKAKQSKI